jgi:hypothetical protein
MDASGQLQDPGALSPRKLLLVNNGEGLCGPQSQSGHGGEEKKMSSLPVMKIKPQASSLYPSHCTD